MAWLDAIFLAFAALIAVLVRCYLERSMDTDRMASQSSSALRNDTTRRELTCVGSNVS